MQKLKKFFQFFSFLLPVQATPVIHRWLILFDGAWVGVYYGEDLSNFYIGHWMDSFPDDPEPITLVEFFQFY